MTSTDRTIKEEMARIATDVCVKWNATADKKIARWDARSIGVLSISPPVQNGTTTYYPKT
jgi:hypothetical protein